VSAVLAARRPAWAIGGFLAISAFSGTLNANFGIVPVRPLVWLLLLGLASATVVGFLRRRRDEPVAVWPGVATLAAYFVFSAFTVPFAETVAIGARAFVFAPALIIVFFAAAYAPWDSQTRWRITKAIVILMLVVGAYALFRLIVGPTAAEAAIARRSAAVAGELALFASFDNRHGLGAWSAVAAPFLFVLTLAMPGRWRWISGSALGLILVALLGSEMRTALVGSVVGIGFATLLYNAARAFRTFRLGITAVAVVGLLAAGGIGYAITVGSDEASATRFEKILSPGSDYSFQRRTRKWEAAVAEINSHPLGQGLGTAGSTQRQFSSVLRLDNKVVENSYLQLGLQQGYPGLILFVASILLILFTLVRSSVFTSDPLRAALGIGGAAALVTWLITLLTGNILESWSALLIWLLVGLAANGFVRRERAPRTVNVAFPSLRRPTAARRSDGSTPNSHRPAGARR
jgi:O-antigen ligase